VDGFRYPQFCALARAAEILGERWTLPLLRELLVGPQRFSDLRRRLAGISPSVLTTRLARLESLGVVRREELPPPAASTVYALTPAGLALEPVLRETMRWGMNFLGPPQPGDHMEPDWIPLTFRLFARRAGAPARSFEVRIASQPDPIRVHVRGGRGGTRVSPAGPAAELTFSASPLVVLGLASGSLDGPATLRTDGVSFEGDPDAIRDFPALFEMRAATP
jgi:DNA-binding HxlR family transcriptional regulator